MNDEINIQQLQAHELQSAGMHLIREATSLRESAKNYPEDQRAAKAMTLVDAQHFERVGKFLTIEARKKMEASIEE